MEYQLRSKSIERLLVIIILRRNRQTFLCVIFIDDAVLYCRKCWPTSMGNAQVAM